MDHEQQEQMEHRVLLLKEEILQRTKEVQMIEGELNPQIKFIFVVPSQINRYLEWMRIGYKKHKSTVVREAIEDAIMKDKEYQKYLQKGI